MTKTKNALISLLASKLSMSQPKARKFVDAFLDHVKSDLEDDGQVRVPHLGTITLVTKEPRFGRSGFSSESIGVPHLIPAITRPKIKYTKRFYDRVKGL